MMDVSDPPGGVEEPSVPCGEGDVVELSLLMPGWQVAELETVAHHRGMTAAAMVRHLLREFLTVAPAQRRVPAT